MSADAAPPSVSPPRRGMLARFLDVVEWLGNKLPDPVILFLMALLITWGVSAVLAPVAFDEIDPRSIGKDAAGHEKTPEPIRIKNLLTGTALAQHLTRVTREFAAFPPLGLVLVSMLGVGVAQHVGLIQAVFKGLLKITPARLLTPALLLAAVASHSAGDSAFVTVVPLGGLMFAAAGRHPLAGIVCAFAGVAGGFTANFVPSGLDGLMQSFTEPAAQLLDRNYKVSILCNYLFMASSSVLIVAVGWYLTERVTEPRLREIAIDGDPADMPKMEPMTPAEQRGLTAAVLAMSLLAIGLIAACWQADSPLRSKTGSLTMQSPLMDSIIPIVSIFALVPGIAYGYAAGTVKSHRDIIKGMSNGMSTMGYYIVLAFFAAQFTYAFRESNLGALIAIKGAAFLAALNLPPQFVIVGIILITALLDLLIASASAKWALLAPIFVPMLMGLGLSPELTQAAYRIGDSPGNAITPLLPYFPLVLLFCQRYVKKTGIGTMISLMLPYYFAYLVLWTTYLLAFWQFGLPLGFPVEVGYNYTPTAH